MDIEEINIFDWSLMINSIKATKAKQLVIDFAQGFIRYHALSLFTKGSKAIMNRSIRMGVLIKNKHFKIQNPKHYKYYII